MIRSALIALGLSAGAAGAQGMVPMAPVQESCGGTRLVLEAADGNHDLDVAAEIVSARIGAAFSTVFDYAEAVDAQIVVSLPDAIQAEAEILAPLLKRIEFGFHEVHGYVPTGEIASLARGQKVFSVVDGDDRFIGTAEPFIDSRAIVSARQTFDQNSLFTVGFRFDARGARTFGDFTTNNIGRRVAIVLDGDILTAPVIQSPIIGGEGIITGAFSVDEATSLAVVLQGGVLPFDLMVVDQIRVDGSNPSADFCP